MAGDPRECRAVAAQCTVWAAETTDSDLKEQLLELAVKWTYLAIAIETTQEIIVAWTPKVL